MKWQYVVLRIIEVALTTAVVLTVLWQIRKLVKRHCVWKLRYSREFSNSRAYCGDSVILTEKIYNPTLLPLFLIDIEGWISKGIAIDGLNVNSSEPMMKSVSRFLIIPPFAEITRKHDILCLSRGKYALESVTVTVCGKTRTLEAETILTVYPEMPDLYTGEPPLSVNYGEYRTRRALIADRFSVSGIRDYRPGDSFGMINFKATARQCFSHGIIKVNAYDRSQNINCAVFLNFNVPRDTHMDYNAYTAMMEKGLGMAAGIVRDVIENGGRVAFFCNCKSYTDAGYVFFPMDGGVMHMYDIFGALAEMRIEDGFSFPALLELYAKAGTEDTQLIVITCRPDENTAEKLETLSRGGKTVSLFPLRAIKNGRSA